MSTFSLQSLSVPVVQAPMAGGPSTPELAAAVSDAGGLGSLAAGYLTAEALAEALTAFRALSSGPVAVNIFVPEVHPASATDVEVYREALCAWRDAGAIDGAVSSVLDTGDDLYEQKLAVVMEHRPCIVSFTFGLPDPLTVARLQEVGITVGVTVTTVEEGAEALSHGADVLIAQGIEAGGHRAQFDQSAAPQPVTTAALVERLAASASAPIVGAGGVDGPGAAQELLDRGAVEVQLGTLFLTTDEAGTKPTHRAALLRAAQADAAGETVLTRVFTGRPARALTNRFTQEMEAAAVVGYPQVHFLTASIRAAAASSDDRELLNLWSGTGVAGCRQEPAASLVARFTQLERLAPGPPTGRMHLAGPHEGSTR